MGSKSVSVVSPSLCHRLYIILLVKYPSCGLKKGNSICLKFAIIFSRKDVTILKE